MDGILLAKARALQSPANLPSSSSLLSRIFDQALSERQQANTLARASRLCRKQTTRRYPLNGGCGQMLALTGSYDISLDGRQWSRFPANRPSFSTLHQRIFGREPVECRLVDVPILAFCHRNILATRHCFSVSGFGQKPWLLGTLGTLSGGTRPCPFPASHPNSSTPCPRKPGSEPLEHLTASSQPLASYPS
jgi:hypothetical protein